jgi:hypothetical protein
MPRPRERICLQDGLKLDLTRLARKGFIKRGEHRRAEYMDAFVLGRAYHWNLSDATNRAHAGRERIKLRLIANLDPDEWDLPPKPKWVRWATYNRHVDRYDRYEDPRLRMRRPRRETRQEFLLINQ